MRRAPLVSLSALGVVLLLVVAYLVAGVLLEAGVRLLRCSSYCCLTTTVSYLHNEKKMLLFALSTCSFT